MLKLIAIKDDPETGLQAMCFEDDYGNRGFSFRGTDFNWEKGAFGEICFKVILASGPLAIRSQYEKQLTFFKEHKNDNGENHLY